MSKKDPDVAGRYFLYVSLNDADALVVYHMDPQTGALANRGKVKVGSRPGAQTIDVAGRFLYVAIRDEYTVATCAIDGKTGALTLRGATPVVDEAVYLAIDRTGRYLLTAYFQAGKAAVYPIQADGTIGNQATVVLDGFKDPHSIQSDPTNRFVYIPDPNACKILQYSFNQQDGTLSPAASTQIVTENENPRHFWFHPSLNVVYFVNENSNSVMAFRRDASNGALTAFQTLSTLPPDYTGDSKCAHIELLPEGRFLYASNRGHDSLAIYSVDAADGKLAFLSHQPTEKKPRSFTIDPTGRFLYSAGQDSGKMTAYRIDQNNGSLQPLASYDVGPGPSWVQMLRLPA
ncbi:MAG: lactonase family protein [Betaproteobacteria bacterium]|nr:lactonase family protein [Betaproteobacteria bacterium]